jgi:hypothetical protein
VGPGPGIKLDLESGIKRRWWDGIKTKVLPYYTGEKAKNQPIRFRMVIIHAMHDLITHSQYYNLGLMRVRLTDYCLILPIER